MNPGPTYALITAARNEGSYLSRTISSLVAQSVPPTRWVVVDDGSTDRTGEILAQAAAEHTFIQLVRSTPGSGRSFGSKVKAVNAGGAQLLDCASDFVGILDADVSLEPSYYQRAIEKFVAVPELGIVGGWIWEQSDDGLCPRRDNTSYSTPGATQLFRRACWDRLGGMLPLTFGGEDWAAEVAVRMAGWKVESFADLKVFHLRPTGAADHLLRCRFREGRMDYSLGSHPVFEAAKMLLRFRQSPVLAGALLRLAGYIWAAIVRDPQPVSSSFVDFLRHEQMQRLRKVRSGSISSLRRTRTVQSLSHSIR